MKLENLLAYGMLGGFIAAVVYYAAHLFTLSPLPSTYMVLECWVISSAILVILKVIR